MPKKREVPKIEEDSLHLERILAYRAASRDIENNCLNARNPYDERPWWDTAIAPNDIEADQVADAVHYLDQRGLLLHHAHNQSLIQILRCPEAPHLNTGAACYCEWPARSDDY